MQKFRTLEMAIEFHKECQSLRLREPYKDQFDRALLSVVLNLSEGSGKPSPKDRKRFYSMAFGSLREVQTLLRLLDLKDLLQKADPVAACLYRLCQNPGHGP